MFQFPFTDFCLAEQSMIQLSKENCFFPPQLLSVQGSELWAWKLSIHGLWPSGPMGFPGAERDVSGRVSRQLLEVSWPGFGGFGQQEKSFKFLVFIYSLPVYSLHSFISPFLCSTYLDTLWRHYKGWEASVSQGSLAPVRGRPEAWVKCFGCCGFLTILVLSYSFPIDVPSQMATTSVATCHSFNLLIN